MKTAKEQYTLRLRTIKYRKTTSVTTFIMHWSLNYQPPGTLLHINTHNSCWIKPASHHLNQSMKGTYYLLVVIRSILTI